MFKDIVSNEEAKSFLINELKNGKKEGTYIFYGEDKALLMEFALSFAKALTCKNERYDFCDRCESCLRMNSLTHGDLEIFEDDNGIKIDSIREIAKISSSATYEGGNRIFIIKDAEKLKKESSNALLKIIEEPEEGDFFILLSKNLNLLPTIKSRSTIVKIKNKTPEEFGITLNEYKFFLGKGKDIEDYKKYNFNIDEAFSYENLGEPLQNYVKLKKELREEKTEEKIKSLMENKIKVYKGLINLYKNIEYIDVAERLVIAENISFACENERSVVMEICDYICHFIKDFGKLEKIMEIKNRINSNVNVKLLLRVLILEL